MALTEEEICKDLLQKAADHHHGVWLMISGDSKEEDDAIRFAAEALHLKGLIRAKFHVDQVHYQLTAAGLAHFRRISGKQAPKSAKEARHRILRLAAEQSHGVWLTLEGDTEDEDSTIRFEAEALDSEGYIEAKFPREGVQYKLTAAGRAYFKSLPSQ
jgi:hypothetical protein